LSDKPRYVLDACVLYPVVVRDLLLTAAALDLFVPIWSDTIVDEMRRNILADRSDVEPESIDRMIAAMSRTFPGASTSGHERLIETMDNDPKDRHVAAAAVHRKAAAIVTYNVRDFRGSVLATEGIEVVTPPKLLERWLDDDSVLGRRVVEAMAKRKVRPPMTADEVADRIGQQQGFETLAGRLTAALRAEPSRDE
jgi:predicted nucleic acid-binding protein